MSLAKTCLDEAHITNHAVVFRQVPKTTFAVFFDSVDTTASADLTNNIKRHDITIELYEYAPDPTSRSALESAMDARAIKWERSDTMWLTEEQIYETIYTFSYFERRA